MVELKDVTVDKITLVTEEHTPAVPKATNQFALFKMKEKPRMMKLKKFLWLETKPARKKKVEKFVAKEIKKLEDGDYLDITMWGYWPDWKYYTYNEWNESNMEPRKKKPKKKISKEDLMDIVNQPTEDVKWMKSYSKKKKNKGQYSMQ